MADQELVLDAQRAHRAGLNLSYAGEAVTAQRTSLGAAIAAASADRPWGKDEIGSAFDKSYRGYETSILEAWRTVGSYVDGLGADVVRSVRSSVDTDAAAAQRIGKTYP
jgi:hypothetical protein